MMKLFDGRSCRIVDISWTFGLLLCICEIGILIVICMISQFALNVNNAPNLI